MTNTPPIKQAGKKEIKYRCPVCTSSIFRGDAQKHLMGHLAYWVQEENKATKMCDDILKEMKKILIRDASI